ncbi:hypothetical protein SLU01_35360 [Sporosarcina luteola]|uniref:NTP pyrophosphohydrolase MazG putative catalytic core domain-containing protein n=1 Tax=Sporosarcina luteola TaxID=582850 RepID=A0A511ZCP4_9BACL|nr:hypothetical protein SLU01_35360 [Sporosarcina luteola]
MHEELAEYAAADTAEDTIEELADLLELIHSTAKFHGTTVEKLEAVREKKAAKRGGFDEQIYLVEAKDDGTAADYLERARRFEEADGGDGYILPDDIFRYEVGCGTSVACASGSDVAWHVRLSRS